MVPFTVGPLDVRGRARRCTREGFLLACSRALPPARAFGAGRIDGVRPRGILQSRRNFVPSWRGIHVRWRGLRRLSRIGFPTPRRSLNIISLWPNRPRLNLPVIRGESRCGVWRDGSLAATASARRPAVAPRPSGALFAHTAAQGGAFGLEFELGGIGGPGSEVSGSFGGSTPATARTLAPVTRTCFGLIAAGKRRLSGFGFAFKGHASPQSADLDRKSVV